ncbi:MAG: SMC family ATPase [Chloroflexi bacterium]|nr:SMC family ATPase [Chloroflexota bacterium]
MVPLELSLHNFLCYREGVPPLALADVRLACLTGENGAGKSALLDAMTWALWGQSRCASDVDLIHLGANEARVEFTYRLGEQDYRVSRRLRRGAATRAGGVGAARTWLDLQTLDTDGVWRSLSGDGVRETQARIIDLLKMEYDTFINSAFLVQGRADEFTTKPAGERKRVLADILGLGVYDGLEQRARERARHLTDDVRALEADLARLRQVVAGEADCLSEEARQQAALAQAEALVERLTGEHQAAHQQVAMLDQQEQHLRLLEAQRQKDDGMVRQLAGVVAGVERDLAALTALLARRDEIEAGADELVAAQQRRAALDRALRAVRALEEQRHRAERAVERARDDLLRDQRDKSRRLSDLDAVARTVPALEAKRETLARSATEATRLTGDISALQEQQQRLHGQAAELTGANGSLMAEMKRLKVRMEQLEAAGAVCPVCNRALGPDDQQRALDDDRREGQQLKERYRANEVQVAALAAEVARCVEEVKELQMRRDRAEIEARHEARLAEQLDQARQAQAEQAALQVALVDVTERLQREAFAVEDRATLGRLTAEIAAQQFDDAAHQAAAAAEQRLAPFAQMRLDVRAAAQRRPEEEAKLANYRTMQAELTERLARDVATVAMLRQTVQQVPALRAREADLASRLEATRRQRADLERSLGRVQVQLDTCRQAREGLVTAEGEWRHLTDEREMLKELSEAFGRNGIQAMIIETVVPELQDEANELLDRMPGNTMRVEFRTQRGTRAGEARETLDVIIRDEVGERRYENYSGGEQFRVNFAIRVALSRLLTRRAGAQLQLLIVDEGFGTQDARGREGLIEAIRSVESVFSTVLVITHLADIRDEFPTQVEVTKGVDGSTILVR